VDAHEGSKEVRVLLNVARAHEAAEEDDSVGECEGVEVVAQHVLCHVALLNQHHLL